MCLGNRNSLKTRDHECRDVPPIDVRATLKLTTQKEEIQMGCPKPGDVPMSDVDRSLTATGAEMQRCVVATANQ